VGGLGAGGLRGRGRCGHIHPGTGRSPAFFIQGGFKAGEERRAGLLPAFALSLDLIITALARPSPCLRRQGRADNGGGRHNAGLEFGAGGVCRVRPGGLPSQAQLQVTPGSVGRRCTTPAFGQRRLRRLGTPFPDAG
jgi:hypothetical protein